MNFTRILAIALITLCTALAWFILGSAVTVRTSESSAQLGNEVTYVWGRAMEQTHPTAFYLSPNSSRGKIILQPARSKVGVALNYDPKKRGLLWHRTYGVVFTGEYDITNPTPIAQTIYVQFPLPTKDTSYRDFAFTLGDAAPRQTAPKDGLITEAVVVAPKQTVPLKVQYASRGMDMWRYVFADASRVR